MLNHARACLRFIAGLLKINSDRKTNSENSAWIRSARPAKVRRKRSKTHRPRRPLWAPGGARRAPCGFWSALSHRLGRPRAANPLRWAPDLVLRSELILEITSVIAPRTICGAQGTPLPPRGTSRSCPRRSAICATCRAGRFVSHTSRYVSNHVGG